VIAKMEWYADKLGGEVTIQRYEYIREAIVTVQIGECNVTVNIGPRGAIKYCSWFLIDEQGHWSTHLDEKSFTGFQNAMALQQFFDFVNMITVKTSEVYHPVQEAA